VVVNLGWGDGSVLRNRRLCAVPPLGKHEEPVRSVVVVWIVRTCRLDGFGMLQGHNTIARFLGLAGRCEGWRRRGRLGLNLFSLGCRGESCSLKLECRRGCGTTAGDL